MIFHNRLVMAVCLVLFGAVLPAQAGLSMTELRRLFDQANDAFGQANAIVGDPKAEKLYDKAILGYEKIITEGEIRNARLYYNLANAYFLKGDIGRAILNYRRAERLDSSDANIQKNLAFARSRRIDRISVKTRERVLQTLFFWHYDFSIETRFVLTCVFSAVVCIALTVIVWFGRSAPATATAIVAAILMLCFLGSVGVETRQRATTACGVITTAEVVARQGDGGNYSASFEDPLHAGTEFDLLECRPGWLHIKLSDDSDAWIPEDSAELV